MPLPHYPGNFNSTIINRKFLIRKKKIERILTLLNEKSSI